MENQKGEYMSDKSQPKIVGNKSEGYNYKYTSLGYLALAGVEIPRMRVAVLTNNEGNPVLDGKGNPIQFVEALVGEEWIRGSQVVIPSGNKMNEAQAYGSALTYARRYATLTVLGIACDDDNKLEVHSKEEADKQLYDNMKKELSELWVKAGGQAKEFNKWFADNTKNGLTSDKFASMKTMLLKKINDNAEGQK